MSMGRKSPCIGWQVCIWKRGIYKNPITSNPSHSPLPLLPSYVSNQRTILLMSTNPPERSQVERATLILRENRMYLWRVDCMTGTHTTHCTSLVRGEGKDMLPDILYIWKRIRIIYNKIHYILYCIMLQYIIYNYGFIQFIYKFLKYYLYKLELIRVTHYFCSFFPL